MPARKTIEDVRKYIKEHDINHECELLSTEYVNNSTPLKLHCNICGKDFERDFCHIQKSKFMCGKCALCLAGKNSAKYSLDSVKKFLIENDKNHECELVSTEYQDSDKPLLFKCNVCGRQFSRSFSNLRHINTGHYCCRTCGHARISPE